MRIGTWNLKSKWSSLHLATLESQECDVRILREMPSEALIPDTTAHCTVHAVDREVLALGLLATSDGGAT